MLTQDLPCCRFVLPETGPVRRATASERGLTLTDGFCGGLSIRQCIWLDPAEEKIETKNFQTYITLRRLGRSELA